jgi:hypothetical protein
MPKIKKLDYETIIKSKWKENASAVPDLVGSGDDDTLKQINTYSDRFDEPIVKIKKKILNDNMFANCFAKDPTRQTSHEKIAFDYLSKHGDILKNFCKLPQSGANAVYLTNDGLFQKYSLTNKKIGKALDFYWENSGKIFYASHKYTRVSGGSQDNSFTEQANLLRRFKENNKNSEFLFVICDGAYYTPAKMKTLKNLTSKRSFAAQIEDVVSMVATIISK